MQGKTYTKVNVPKDNSTWMIENAIAQYRGPPMGGGNSSGGPTDMHVQMFRTSTGTALQSWSSDGGYNWTYAVNSSLPNPNSRVSCPVPATSRMVRGLAKFSEVQVLMAGGMYVAVFAR